MQGHTSSLLLLTKGREVDEDLNDEIKRVNIEERDEWLAGKLQATRRWTLRHFEELEDGMDRLANELKQTREDMHSSANKVVFSVLGASLALLASAILYAATVS